MARILAAGAVFAVLAGGAVLADDKALKELDGAYKATALTKGGKVAPDDLVAGTTATFAGGELTVTVNGKAFPSKVKVDPSKKPAHIDISPTDGPEKGKTFPGVYKLDKGELVIAFAERPGADRPKDFTGDADATVLKLKRADPK
ncbi:MAG: TIGR03067 domain-containing protein [Gemmataceae bacterium]|nr:TIGR03067 domain-containing protein [Gemmataceae bacterium]